MILMDKTETRTLRKILARNMRIRRAELDITQEEVALRTGLSQAYLSGIEREKRNVSLDNIQKIALALETTGAVLLTTR
jgi:transcriptional regulator with XRE-family HTH domain